MFTGLMYNDIFSKSLHLWRSGWNFSDPRHGAFNGHVYPFGLDPGWHGADNSLIFTNSYKMKMSIIIGVIHVCFDARLDAKRPNIFIDDICHLPSSSQSSAFQTSS